MITRYVTGIYCTYLSTLSHERLSEKKEDHHGETIRRSSGMDILNIAAPPRQPLRDGLLRAPTKDFI